jgi:hypothetical protein
MRNLSRQFAKLKNMGKPWQPGNEAAPQGSLFKGYQLDRPRPPAAEMESNRRLMAGQKVNRPTGLTPTWNAAAKTWHGQADDQQKLF